MFVRIRGKGACPENSQAAVMHIRGFRHTHSKAPPDSFYPVLHDACASPSSLASPSPASSAMEVEMRPFRFPLFPVGIHATTLTAAQAKFMAAGADAAPASCMAALDSEAARMVWKETWNLYDILYDEVPLLPWSELAVDADVLAETVEAELRKLAAGGEEGEPNLQPLSTLQASIGGNFVLASARAGNQKLVVCPHYYAPAALPEHAFAHIQRHRDTHAAVPHTGPVVVLDLRDLAVAQAGGKAMVNVAWCAAFAAMQPDSVLLRCRAVVVRLPYAVVPTYAQAARHCSRTAAAAAPTMADAFVEAVDFIGEHITAVRHAMARELGTQSTELAQACGAAAPPIVVIGSEPTALRACLQRLAPAEDAAASATTTTTTTAAAPASVVVFHGDHLVAAETGEGGSAAAAADTHVVGTHTSKAAEYQAALDGMASGAMTVETVLVPLKALLDGGDEAWDPYTLRERQRLNFCPCCGDCGNEGEGDGADHGHSHGHGHGH